MAPVVCEPSFICTFCWTPQRPPSTPKVLGHEARIACEWCWKSVLDLSICWMCGEMVARGEEVVSLGWCFWHMGCFGCLLCGMGLEPPVIEEVNGEEKGGWNGGGAGIFQCSKGEVEVLRKRKRHVGVELEYIPLCSWCENATEGMQEKELLETGLANVTRRDGGLSRSRFDLLSGVEEGNDWHGRERGIRSAGKNDGQQEVLMNDNPARSANLSLLPPPVMDPQVSKASGLRQMRRTFVKPRGKSDAGDTSVEDRNDCSSGPPKDAAKMTIGEDGNIDGPPEYISPAEDKFASTPQLIYVSVSNVVGEPSFRPSKTKPLPKWMSLLPRNRYQTSIPDSGRPTPLDSGSTGTDSPSAYVASTLLIQSSDLAPTILSFSKTEDVDPFNFVATREPHIAASIYSGGHEAKNGHIERKQTAHPLSRSIEHLRRHSMDTRSSFPYIYNTTKLPASILNISKPFISVSPARVADPFLVKDLPESGTNSTQRSWFPSPTEPTHYVQTHHRSRTGGVWKNYMARGAEP